MNNVEVLRQYAKERDKVFGSFNEKKIRAFAKKYNIPVPTNEEAFWRGVAKVVVLSIGTTEKQKKKARKMLEKLNMKEWIE